jgi:ComF family protein
MGFWLPELVHLFYPEACAACGNSLFSGEKTLCTQCLYYLPKTGFHLKPDNPVARQFWGKVNIHSATSLYFFHKGERVQRLIHRLKYKGEKDVGVFTGRMLGELLMQSPLYQGVNMIVPVPLHNKKLLIRGYNQSDYFAKGISEIMKAPFVSDYLVRSRVTQTQTRKSRFSRFENVDKVFQISNKYESIPKHFLLVDDVITTGSTLASCAETLLQVAESKVSIATIAYARL